MLAFGHMECVDIVILKFDYICTYRRYYTLFIENADATPPHLKLFFLQLGISVDLLGFLKFLAMRSSVASFIKCMLHEI